MLLPALAGGGGAGEDGLEAPEVERHQGSPALAGLARGSDGGEQEAEAPARHHHHHHHHHSSRRRQRRRDDAADDSDDSFAEGLLMRDRGDGSLFDMEIAGDVDELVLAVEEAATAREMEDRARGEESASSKGESYWSSSSESEGEDVVRAGLLRARGHSSGAGAVPGGSPAARWRIADEPGDGDVEAGFERRLTRLNSEMDELIVDSFNEHYSEGWKMKAATTVLQVGVIVTALAVLVYSVQQVFPDLKEQLKSWASWANGQGDRGAAAFALGAALIMLVPGVPGSLLCFTCGTVFPFGRALLIAATGHHLGACLAFAIARVACRTRFEKLLVTRPTLKTMSAAAKIQQWKVTFLSRFIVMPVQIKNYLFGVLPVSPPCFFLMAFLGDTQSILFSTYLGSISKSVLESAAKGAIAISAATAADQQLRTPPPGPQVVIGVVELENGQFDLETGTTAGWLPVLSLLVAASMTTIASVVARRAYLQVLCDIKLDQAAAVRKLKRERRRSSSLALSPPIRVGGGLDGDAAGAGVGAGAGGGGPARGSSPRVSTAKDLW